MMPRHALLPLPGRADAERLARDWLARQWAVDAEAVPLRRDARGRPRMTAPMEDRDAGWSHSGGQLLVACGEGLRLGCDLEYIRPRPNARALAARFFHPEEHAWLAGLPDAGIAPAFLRLWCAKEAVLKAHGHGLSFGMQRLHFAEDAGGLRLVACDAALGDPRAWRLREWGPMPGFIAVLAWHALPAPESGAAIL